MSIGLLYRIEKPRKWPFLTILIILAVSKLER